MATPTFNGVDLTTLGLVDLDNSYRPFNYQRQFREAEAPGVSGSQLLIGGIRSQDTALMIRLSASGTSNSEAESNMLGIDQTLVALVGDTALFEDPYGVAWADTTLLGLFYVPGNFYFQEGSVYYLRRDVVLQFKRSLTQ